MSLTKMMPDKGLIRKVTEILFKELGYSISKTKVL
jgi:hypothetical protein